MREVGWPPRVEIYMKWKRQCREVFNAVKVLIPFKWYHRDLMKLHVPLGGFLEWEKVRVFSKRINFLWSGKIRDGRPLQKLLKSYLSIRGSLESSNATKGDSTKRRDSSGKIPFSGWCGATCENLVGFSMYDGYIETVEYICLNVGVSLIGFFCKTAGIHYLCT